MLDLESQWRAARLLIAHTRDIIDERPTATPPRWAAQRGWVDWLVDLDDAALRRCERDGLAAHARALGAPSSLCAHAERAAQIATLPSIATPTANLRRARVSARKRRQVAAFAALVAARRAGVARIVDFGAGHGHLTRHLAEALGVEGVGVERDGALVDTARALGGARFVTADLFAEAPDLCPTDLVVGLHACGALTDRLLDVAVARDAAIAVVACCAHKIPTPTRISRMPGPAALHLPRGALGLANINHGAQGIEASLSANLAARARRAGVRCLLAARGVSVPEGAEMNGLNRRRAFGPFDRLAAEVLSQRGLPPATLAELRTAEQAGAAQHARVRRWSIARRALGRSIEVFIALDRAMSLAHAGYQVELGTLWPSAVSPRNIGLVARR